MKKIIVIISAFLILSSPAFATTTIEGDGTLGDYIGSLTYASTGADSANFDVYLKNTTASGEGYLTAFAFNNPGDKITGASFTETNFQVIGQHDDDPDFDFQNQINAEPLGYFDIGGSITNAWLGGGSPNTGLAPGSENTFNFSLTGTGVGGLSEAEFINALSYNGSDEFFGVRFRGFPGTPDSDKVPGVVTPEPVSSALFFMGAGMLGLAYRRKASK